MTESDIAPLWNELRQIRDGQTTQKTMLETHMTNSANNHESLRCEISEIKVTLNKSVSDTQELFASLPEDDHGRASTFVHKTHHNKTNTCMAGMQVLDRRNPEKESLAEMIKRIWLERLISGAFIVLAIILGLGLKDYIAHPSGIDSQIVKEVNK